MIALARPGSLPWLVLHDVRVKARGREGRWGRIIAMLLLALLPIVGGAVMAWRVRGGADLPLAALGSVGAVLLGMMLVMVSSAYAHVLRLGRDRGELELLLTAPLPVARVVAARVAGVQAVVALPFLLLTAPFFLFSAAFGHVTWVAGPLVVVLFAVGANEAFRQFAPELHIAASHLVQVPVSATPWALADQIRLPDFGAITNPKVWTLALTLAIVASLESLLSVKAVDELDPKRRVTDKNRELLAQGVGNVVSGLLGGLPVTSVIVRSSANVETGADSRLSTMLHGTWLLLGLALMPAILNLIPLSALAAVLIATGYKLAKPALFLQRWKQGLSQFIPFVVTVLAILFTDLLIGIAIGLVVGMGFVIWRSAGNIITYVEYGGTVMVRARRNLYFMHKPALVESLSRVPDGAELLIDLSATSYVDLDCIDIINGFVKAAGFRDINVRVRPDPGRKTAALINAPVSRARAT